MNFVPRTWIQLDRIPDRASFRAGSSESLSTTLSFVATARISACSLAVNCAQNVTNITSVGIGIENVLRAFAPVPDILWKWPTLQCHSDSRWLLQRVCRRPGGYYRRRLCSKIDSVTKGV